MVTSSSPASPLFLREAEIRRGIELLSFGYGQLSRASDDRLAAENLGRAHHRALYFIARRPDLTVSTLLTLLSVTKQSLGRVLNDLVERELVESRIGRDDRRQRLLRLTPAGTALESELFEIIRAKLAEAYGEAGPTAVAGFWQVLEALIPDNGRATLTSIRKG